MCIVIGHMSSLMLCQSKSIVTSSLGLISLTISSMGRIPLLIWLRLTLDLMAVSPARLRRARNFAPNVMLDVLIPCLDRSSDLIGIKCIGKAMLLELKRPAGCSVVWVFSLAYHSKSNGLILGSLTKPCSTRYSKQSSSVLSFSSSISSRVYTSSSAA